MTEVRIRVPRVPAGLGSNLLGLAGLIAVAAALGGLLGNWWVSALAGGVFAVALAALAQNAQAATATRKLAAVPDRKAS